MLEMELYQLRTFVTVAETGNLTQAAERIFSSLPAVSAHIKALEEELKIKLFERSAKGMRLTEHGMILKEKAQQVIDAGAELKLKAKTLSGEMSSIARIGLNSDTNYLRLARWHTALMTEHSELKIQLAYDTSTELLKQVKQGLLDISFLSGKNEDKLVQSVELCVTDVVIAAAPKWKQQLDQAGVEELAQLPWIKPEPLCVYHKLINELFLETIYKPSAITDSATEDTTLALVRSGAGLAFIRDDEALPLLQSKEITLWPERSFSLPLSLSYLKSRAEDPLIKALIKIISQSFLVTP